MNYNYPLLEKVFGYYKSNSLELSCFRIYSCQHLLEPQLEMFRRFIEYGFSPKNIFVLGKAYSSNAEIGKGLEAMGINVIQQPFKGGSFDEEHARNCKELAAKIANADANILLDDGGCLIAAASQKRILFGVEQTSSGFRKLDGLDLHFPVFNVARSNTKLTQESPNIARIIFERIQEYIADNNLHVLKMLVVGMGPIGLSVYEILTGEKFEVISYDRETHDNTLVQHVLENKPDMIIGATGEQILNRQQIDELVGQHVYHLVSASSSDREFEVAPFRGNAKAVHDNVTYKNIVFLNNGFPITFLGRRYEATPVEMEKTMALLMGSVMHGVSRKIEGSGLVDVPRELELIING